MNHDGMDVFPAAPRARDRSDHGLLAVNFEYTDDNLLTPEGMEPWTAEKAQKSKNAHGIGVFEVRCEGGAWRTVPDSRFGRRITADTPITLAGPRPATRCCRPQQIPRDAPCCGTFNNCAGGRTPWGTYLVLRGERRSLFRQRLWPEIPRLQERYGIPTTAESWGYRWQRVRRALRCRRPPQRAQPLRLGGGGRSLRSRRRRRSSAPPWAAWPTRAPRWPSATTGGSSSTWGTTTSARKFEHIYKFVSREPSCRPAGRPAENRDLLDDGTLYAARFDADGTGVWLPLRARGTAADRRRTALPRQAEVLIGARTGRRRGRGHLHGSPGVGGGASAHAARCTAASPTTARAARASRCTSRAAGRRRRQPARPQPHGTHHPLARGRRRSRRPPAFAGTSSCRRAIPPCDDPLKQGNVPGGVAFAQPDGLTFDARGVLWIQTDSSAQNMASPDWTRIGNNQMLAADPAHRRGAPVPHRRRWAARSPALQLTPDQRTMFVNIQHPGEPPQRPPRPQRPGAPQGLQLLARRRPAAAARARPPSPSAAATAELSGRERRRQGELSTGRERAAAQAFGQLGPVQAARLDERPGRRCRSPSPAATWRRPRRPSPSCGRWADRRR